MISEDQTNWCYGCGAEITLAAVLHNKHLYCCQDCAEGRSCDCAEQMQPGEDQLSRKQPPESVIHYPD